MAKGVKKYATFLIFNYIYKKKIMNKEQKLLSALSLMPVMADLLEDVEFERVMKMRVNALINQIRSIDNHFMTGADEETHIQQNNIQLWFRKQLNENFK